MDQAIDAQTLEKFNDFFYRSGRKLTDQLDQIYIKKEICYRIAQGIAEMSYLDHKYFDLNQIILEVNITRIYPFEIVDDIIYALEHIYQTFNSDDYSFQEVHELVNNSLHTFIVVNKYC